MPWKLNEAGAFVVDENKNPVWVTDTGEEKSVDYPAMSSSLSTANREAAERKAKIRQLEERYKAVADIEDLSSFLNEAQKALDMAKNAPDKEKALEEQVRARVDAATQPLNEKLKKADEANQALMMRLQSEAIGSAFARSRYVQEKIVSPGMAADLFSSMFSLNEEGKLVGKGPDGQPIYGENGLASFDEAIAKLVDASPYKGHLLKGSDKSGSGAGPSGNAGGGTGAPTTLADCKTEADKIAYLKQKAGDAG